VNSKKTQLIDIMGKDSVFDNPETGESFSLAYNLIPPVPPRFMVKPENTDKVQKLVLWANRTKTPLVPVSSGGPCLRGGTAPVVPESVIVDLRKMKRILKINRRNRLALIEPGVTYGQLQAELKKEGLRIIPPLLPCGNKSVLASLLEREPVISPRYQWNLLEPLRSLEIIWGNGDKFYSGSGTFRGEKEEDWEQGLVPLQGPGPGQADFYKFVSAAQGSMGIVTWASVKCEVYPELRKLFFIPAEKIEDVIDCVYTLLKFRFGDELFILNNTCLAWILAEPPRGIESLKKKLPRWIVVVGITGGQLLPREKVEAREKDIKDITRQSGLSMTRAIPGCNSSELLTLLLEPSKEPYWKIRYAGGAQEIFFLTTLDKTPGFISTINSIAEEQYSTADTGMYIQPAHQGTCCHCEFILPFHRENQAEMSGVEALFRRASRELFRQGAFFSRPYGIWAEMVYNADARNMIVTQKIKKIFDPNNVMNPGKLCF
jgi:FAD/FMN-containing dehydrogenase